MAKQTPAQKKAAAAKKAVKRPIPNMPSPESRSKAFDTRKSNQQIVAEVLELDMLEIEMTPPPPTRGDTEGTLKLLALVDKTIRKLPKGAAFLIPTSKKPSVARYLVNTYADYTWKFFTIPDNKAFTRVYQMVKSA